MANSKQAKKRATQAEKRRLRNASQRTSMRTAIKKTLKAISSNDKENVSKLLVSAFCLLDRLAGKGIIPKNRAARTKSRLNTRVKNFLTAA